MARRKKIPENTGAQVLTGCRRRCCICWAIRQDVSEKKGQIAHLDRDPSNHALDNLAFLCLEHHDQYDSKTSQSKGFTIEEVKRYRDQLLKTLSDDTIRPDRSSPIASDVRVQVNTAIAGVPWGDPEPVLAIQVENHSAASVFIRSVTIELTNKSTLFYKCDYLTKALNARRELRSGERFDFYITPKELFNGRTPEELDAAVATDDIGRIFRSDAEKFRQIVKALYKGFRKDTQAT